MAKRFSIKKLTAGALAALMVVTALPVSGITASVSKAADDTAKVYRSYNPNNGEHLYTIDKSEHDYVVGLGYDDEGERFVVPTSSKTAIYRAYDPNSGEHLLVPKDEAEWLETLGWDNEGIKMYADDNKSAGVYRVYNPNATSAGRHNYSNKEEADWLVAQGWQYDHNGEPVFYALKLLDGEKLTITAEQTGANTIVVDSNIEIKENDKVVLKKGSTEQTIKWAIGDDKKTITITTEGKITDGEYTVSVTPVEENKDTAEASLNGETERLDGILFGENLALVDSTNFYTVQTTISGRNQFDEEYSLGTGTLSIYPSIAKVADGTAAAATNNVATGCTTGYNATTKVYTLTKDSTVPFQLGDTVTLTAIYQSGSNVVQDTAELEVSNVPYVSEITFGEIATTSAKLKGARITVKNFSTNTYYIPIVAKDQYGNTLSAARLTALKTGNALFVSPAKDDGVFGGFDSFDTLDDGTVIAKLGAKTGGILPGETTLSFAGLGGLSETTSFTVEENPYIDVFNVAFPSTLIQGTPATIDVSATDQYGDPVDLYSMTITNSGTQTLAFGDKNTMTQKGSELKMSSGTLSVSKNSTKKTAVFTYTPPAALTDIATITTATPTVDTRALTITAKGTPASIRSTLDTSKNDSSLEIASGKDVDFASALVFIDSNGKEVDGTIVTKPSYKYATGATDTTATGIGTITSDTTEYHWTIFNETTGYYSNDTDGKLEGLTTSATYRVELYKIVDVSGTETPTLLDSKKFKVTVAAADTSALNPYESYRAEIKAGDELLANYASSGDTTTINVYGTDANGVEVLLTPTSDYTLTSDGAVGTITGNEIASKGDTMATGTNPLIEGESEITVWSVTTHGKNKVTTIKVPYSNAPQKAQTWVVLKGTMTVASTGGAVTIATVGAGLTTFAKTGTYESDTIDVKLTTSGQKGYLAYSASAADASGGGVLTIASIETAAATAGNNTMTAYKVFAIDQYGMPVTAATITANGKVVENSTAVVTKVGANNGTDTNAKNETNGSYVDTFTLAAPGLETKTIVINTVVSGN